MSPETYRVLLANADKDELRELAQLVEQGGHEVVALAITSGEAGEAIVEHRPQMAMILLEAGEFGHTLRLMDEIASYADIPLVMLARSIDDETLRAVAEQSMEVLHLPSRAETVAGVIRIAAERAAERRSLERRVGEIDSILDRRSTVEQAKGILMERHGVSPEAAFERIRDHARSNNLRVVDVAASVITARELLSGDPLTAAPE